MDEKKFNDLVAELKKQNGIESAFLVNSDGKLLFNTGSYAVTDDEAKKILLGWKAKEAGIMYNNLRFAMLKNDELQFAAKNIVQHKGNLVGSKTRDGNYLLAHTRDEGLIILEWSILINKVAWM